MRQRLVFCTSQLSFMQFFVHFLYWLGRYFCFDILSLYTCDEDSLKFSNESHSKELLDSC